VNAKLEAYLSAKYADEKEERDLFLIQLGLCEKVYSPDNEPSDEYYSCEGEGENTRYFKLVPIEVTQEEYQQLRKYNPKPAEPYKNKVSTLLKVLAWIVYIGGFLTGIAIIIDAGAVAAGLVYWTYALFIGSAMLGLSQAVKLLGEIKTKIEK